MRSIYTLPGKYIALTLVMLFCMNTLQAQRNKKSDSDKELIQLSGVISADPKTPIPFSTVRIKNTIRGTIAAVDGFYSLVVKPLDTVEYVALGFKTASFVVPGGVQDNKHIHNVMLLEDTITYANVDLYPLPSPEEFREAFMNLKIDDTYEDLAKKNLDQQKLMELYESLARDGKENQIYALQQIASSYYYAGGQRNFSIIGGSPVPTSLLNPFAWSQFIKAIQDGKFKKKK